MPLNREQQVLVENNMGLVGKVIKENVHNINNIGLFTYHDIYQIGCLGLIKAARGYKPGESKFSTYAYIAIRNKIYNALDYATVRRNGEVVTGIEDVIRLVTTYDEYSYNKTSLDSLLEAARNRATGVTAKGIDAIRLLSDGFTNREVGELMGGVSANYITAWVSKARAFLKKDPAIIAYREAI
jgi:RNA polymerase sigma factor (sigma-70 family)